MLLSPTFAQVVNPPAILRRKTARAQWIGLVAKQPVDPLSSLTQLSSLNTAALLVTISVWSWSMS